MPFGWWIYSSSIFYRMIKLGSIGQWTPENWDFQNLEQFDKADTVSDFYHIPPMIIVETEVFPSITCGAVSNIFQDRSVRFHTGAINGSHCGDCKPRPVVKCCRIAIEKQKLVTLLISLAWKCAKLVSVQMEHISWWQNKQKLTNNQTNTPQPPQKN